MQNKQLIILISGTPGTGKTTIAQILKKKFSARCINLTEIAIANNFIIEADNKRETKVVNLKKLIPYIKNFINSNPNNIIIEGHYADIVPDSLVSIFIILRTDPNVLEQRLKDKKFYTSKIQENLQSEILGSCTQSALECHDRNKIYEVDTSLASLKETVEIINNFLEKKPPSNVGQINWMRKLEEKNELLKYFSEKND